MTNVILEECTERVYAPDAVPRAPPIVEIAIETLSEGGVIRQGVEELVHGLFIVRGDNM